MEEHRQHCGGARAALLSVPGALWRAGNTDPFCDPLQFPPADGRRSSAYSGFGLRELRSASPGCQARELTLDVFICHFPSSNILAGLWKSAEHLLGGKRRKEI